MIFMNLATKKGKITRNSALTFTKILSPFAPHLAEELWNQLGNNNTLAYEPWPEVNEEYLKEDVFEYPVSFNGKMRFKITFGINTDKDVIIKTILSDPRTLKWLDGKEPANIFVVPNRIINIVIK